MWKGNSPSGQYKSHRSSQIWHSGPLSSVTFHIWHNLLSPCVKSWTQRKRVHMFHSPVTMHATERWHHHEWLKSYPQQEATTGSLGRMQWNTAALQLLPDGLWDSNQHVRRLKCSQGKGTIRYTSSVTNPLPRQAGTLPAHSIYADQVHGCSTVFFFFLSFFTWAWFSNASGGARCRWGQFNCQLLNAEGWCDVSSWWIANSICQLVNWLFRR